MFSALDDKEQNIVIGAFEEKKFKLFFIFFEFIYFI